MQTGPFAENARRDLDKAARGTVYAIHMSCGIVKGDPASVPINLIAVKRLGAAASVEVFDARREGERESLDRFAAFVASVERQDAGTTWVGWNFFGKVNFGLAFIRDRHRRLGGEPVDPANRLDLPEVLEALYGPDYIEHPRLPNLIRLNGLTEQGQLTGEGAAAAFAEGRFDDLRANTLRRTESVGKLYMLTAAGALKTAADAGAAGGAEHGSDGFERPVPVAEAAESIFKKAPKTLNAWARTGRRGAGPSPVERPEGVRGVVRVLRRHLNPGELARAEAVFDAAPDERTANA